MSRVCSTCALRGWRSRPAWPRNVAQNRSIPSFIYSMALSRKPTVSTKRVALLCAARRSNFSLDAAARGSRAAASCPMSAARRDADAVRRPSKQSNDVSVCGGWCLSSHHTRHRRESSNEKCATIFLSKRFAFAVALLFVPRTLTKQLFSVSCYRRAIFGAAANAVVPPIECESTGTSGARRPNWWCDDWVLARQQRCICLRQAGC